MLCEGMPQTPFKKKNHFAKKKKLEKYSFQVLASFFPQDFYPPLQLEGTTCYKLTL